MKQEYVPPTFNERAFNCPYCTALSPFKWIEMGYVRGAMPNIRFQQGSPLVTGTCIACNRETYWLKPLPMEEGIMIYPKMSLAPDANDDMPEDARLYYEEARMVREHSPRASAALLRVCLEKTLYHLGEVSRENDLNKAIGNLVSKGVPVPIQQSLDSLRIVGNDVLHADSQIRLDENPANVDLLFKLVNKVVQFLITEPNELKALYDGLPPNKLKGVEDRDK